MYMQANSSKHTHFNSHLFVIKHVRYQIGPARRAGSSPSVYPRSARTKSLYHARLHLQPFWSHHQSISTRARSRCILPRHCLSMLRWRNIRTPSRLGRSVGQFSVDRRIWPTILKCTALYTRSSNGYLICYLCIYLSDAAEQDYVARLLRALPYPPRILETIGGVRIGVPILYTYVYVYDPISGNENLCVHSRSHLT